MATENRTINTFTSRHVAFYRPIKRTYYILEWNPEFRCWSKYSQEHPLITLHRTTNHGEGICKFYIQKGRNQRYEIRIHADGHFLKAGDLQIPILRKTAGHMTEGCIGREYTTQDILTNPQAPPYLQNIALWSYLLPVIIKIKHPSPEAIPQRIAKLIVQESVSKEELCPITMESITSSNSAVTSCFHVFLTDALESWFERNPAQHPCPVCRKVCVMTKV
jgi:hypothetical protein